MPSKPFTAIWNASSILGAPVRKPPSVLLFKKLLDEYAKAKDLLLIPEVSIRLKNGKTVTPDGTLKDALRFDYGC